MPPPRVGLLRRIAARRFDLTITLRRGETSIAAQSASVVTPLTHRGSTQWGDAGREARGQAELWGAPTMDVLTDDRLTVDGVLYRVVFVRPERDAATVADLEVVE